MPMPTLEELVPAYLVEWIDEVGQVVRIQTMSEFPGTQGCEHRGLRQRLASMVLGVDFHHAHRNLLSSIDRADPNLGAYVRKQVKLGR